jgi:DNA-binding beta-propeller fold protein YncE
MYRIDFTATEAVKGAILNLGRTEDVKFSPNNRRLAVAGYFRNKLVVFDVDIAVSSAGKRVNLTGFQEITSTSLKLPHGLSFIDDETLVVANLGGQVPILKLPAAGASDGKWELTSLRNICDDHAPRPYVPGSLTVSHLDQSHCEVLVCNSKTHNVTRHTLEINEPFVVNRNEVLLNRGLNAPDGVAISRDRRWIAISNHNEHNVLLYENTPRLNSNSRPDGILRYVNFPHGVRFTPDGNFVLVADAGSPYVNVYAKNGRGWEGKSNPVSSFRVMDEEVYLRGRSNPEEGGPKGIDIDRDMNVLVTTSAEQPLSFFDLPAILKRRTVPMERRQLFLNWRVERIRKSVRVVRNDLRLRTRLRRLCGF